MTRKAKPLVSPARIREEKAKAPEIALGGRYSLTPPAAFAARMKDSPKWSYSQLPNSFPNEGNLVSKRVPICPILELTKTKNPASSSQKTLGFM